VWLGTSLYTFVLKTSTDTLVWTSDAVGGTVTSSTYNAFVAALAASGGSDLIGYTSTLTVQDKLQQYLSVKDYGAIGNGTANDTSAVNTGIATATAAGRALYFPAGTYLVSQITALVGMKLVGESSLTTIVKAKGSSNVDLVTSPSTTIDDVWIESIRFDGNSAGNTAGDTLVIKGHRPTLIDLVVIDSAANAIVTDWAGPSFRTAGSEGYFSHITIDSPQKSGWLHSGPSDSYFEDIIIIDPGQKTTASYYGLYLDPTGSGSNGRFNNLHHWTRSNATKIALTGVYVGFGGNTFTNCHFEGGNLPLNIASNFNTFAACAYYAPRTGYAVNIGATSSANYLDGALGLTFYSGNANYTGVNLAGAGNTLNLTAGGAITAINFGDSATGSNFVRINGYIDAGGAAYAGTQAADDDILIQIAGAGGGQLVQSTPHVWTAYTPTITAGSGTITTVSATGRYIRNGATVQLQIAVTMTTNGTGAGNIYATLPVQAAAHEYVIAGRNNTTGKMLQGDIISGATEIRIFDYANVYPIANGQIIYVSGSYESL
jgi:hypothetical protein